MFRAAIFSILSMLMPLACMMPVAAQDPVKDAGKIKLHSPAVKASRYPVFFVTDRQVQQSPHGLVFGSERSCELRYGTFRPSHPEVDKVDLNDVHLVSGEDQFLSALQQTKATKVAVFVHGYRKCFEGSLQFAERIASELEVPVVLFAWPSKNKYSAYMADECTAEWSSYQLAGTLRDLGTKFENKNISLISHSLGARIVSWSLRILASQNQLREPFDCSLFFSPDVDRDTFVAESPFIKQCCSRVNVYLDRHDSRIWLSKVLHGNPRLGTFDDHSENTCLTNLFHFDTSMPSHEIPYPLLSAAVHNAGSVATAVRN